MIIKKVKTKRGFDKINFTDAYNEKCSIQKSSAINDRIWIGIDNPKLIVFANDQMGKYFEMDMPKQFSVSSRMYLTREQITELLPHLINFSETGTL